MGMSGDADPVVRVAWAQKMGLIAVNGGADAAGALAALQKQAAGKRDLLVRRCIKAVQEDVQQTVEAGKKGSQE